MNKLYKYLPFDIKLCKYYKNLLTGELIPYHRDLNSGYYSTESILNGNLDGYKPILRPFEDLTKELPLTKAAAEMIGMKEGDLIKCIDKCSLDTFTTWQHSLIEISVMFYNFKIEKDLDFLRAMHFAVDFKEDEYIRYETH